MKGYLAIKEGVKNAPAIIIVHEWWGLNDYAKKRAEMLAKLGYVALAVDMYGNGETSDNPTGAKKLAMSVMGNKDRAEKRFKAAIKLLKNHPNVDATKIAAIGYCFGGGVVLEMARRGIDLNGVVSFHGSLGHIQKPKRGAEIKARILVLNGEADPLVKIEHIKTFKTVMKKAGADFHLINFPNATHAFSNPAATEVGKKYKLPVAYNEQADFESWEIMKKFFSEIF